MVDKTMMGDKCAELVRAAMIGALAVTLGNPTAVYAAEEETADPGQIGIEIAGEAAVGAASFCVEEDAAEEAPAEAEEVTEPEGTQNDEMEEESGSEGKEDETVPEEPEPQEPDGGENAGMTEPGKTGETEPEGPENAEPGEAGETEPEEPENPEPGDQGDMPETPGNSEMDGPWPGEGEDISNDPWPGQEEIGGGDGEQMEPPEEENGSAGSDDATGGDKTAEVSSDSDLSQSAEPPAAEAEPVFSAEQEAERTRESYSEWQAAEAEKVTISRMPWLFHTVEKTYAIADVNSWLHVREGKGTNQKIVGILPKGSLCYILARRLALIFSTGGFKYSYFDDFGTAVIACYEFCFETVKCSAACKRQQDCRRHNTQQFLKMCVFHRFLLCIQSNYTIFAAKGKGLKFILFNQNKPEMVTFFVRASESVYLKPEMPCRCKYINSAGLHGRNCALGLPASCRIAALTQLAHTAAEGYGFVISVEKYFS